MTQPVPGGQLSGANVWMMKPSKCTAQTAESGASFIWLGILSESGEVKMESSSSRAIQCDPEIFRRNLNRLPYEIAHNLSGDPLFELSRLVDLAERVAKRTRPHLAGGDVYCNDGMIAPGEKSIAIDKPDVAAVDLIRRIDTAQAWIILKHVEREPGYRDILEKCICDILQLSGPELLKKIKWFEAILFITSPNRITEYHLDREVSWVLQIQGDKEIHLYDRADKEIVPDEELEVYWTANNKAAQYKPEYESRALVYEMSPGSGVHIPINTPHWLRNKANISVTLNVNFQFHDYYWANLYRANYYLRRAGFSPQPPGVHPFTDHMKSAAFTVLQRAKSSAKGRVQIPEEARRQNRRIAEMVSRA